MLVKVFKSLVMSPSLRRPLPLNSCTRFPSASGSNGILATFSPVARKCLSTDLRQESRNEVEQQRITPEHAVISTFDLFSIGGLPYSLYYGGIEAYDIVGPSSSHTVGPMRAARIFIMDLKELNLLAKVSVVSLPES